MKLPKKLRKNLEFHVLRVTDVAFLLVFDLIVYTLAVACLYFAIAIAEWFFPGSTPTVEVAKVVSSACAIVGYTVYTLADLTLYLVKVWKGLFYGK